MRDDGEDVVGLRVFHSRGTKNVFSNEVDVFLRGGAFEDAAENGVAVSRVMELRARLGEQRIRGEELQGFFHGREVACAVIGDVALSVVIVVANSAGMGGGVGRRDGGIFLGGGGGMFL